MKTAIVLLKFEFVTKRRKWNKNQDTSKKKVLKLQKLSEYLSQIESIKNNLDIQIHFKSYTFLKGCHNYNKNYSYYLNTSNLVKSKCVDNWWNNFDYIFSESFNKPFKGFRISDNSSKINWN